MVDKSNLVFLPRDAGKWPSHRSSIIDWLVNETRTERFIDNILLQLCERLRVVGIPVARATIHFRTHHPQWLGARILWRSGMSEAKITTFDYGVESTPQFLLSPANEIYAGELEVRQGLESSECGRRYPLFSELKAEGLTDYIAWPLSHTTENRHILTFASDRPGGFVDQDLALLRDLVPLLSLVTEVRLKNVLTRTFLETYVGPHAARQVLAGATTRGSGVTISAAIMICDLRDFTAISDLWPRDDVIEMLNGYFDALSEPIEQNGGEILKFMGDGMLAIFPMANADACRSLLASIRSGAAAMNDLNDRHAGSGRPILRYGVGVHVGDVMYGNIGSRKRLDFTAIGPAVNIASRLETLTKMVGRPVLLSKDFIEAAKCTEEVDDLGRHQLRGLGQPIDVFALR
jgi:adenylate cyclase